MKDLQQFSGKFKQLIERFEAQVERTPENIAVRYERQQLTYRELNERANQLAHHLLAQNVVPEQLIGICLERTPEVIVAILGVLKAGCAFVPLDLAYPKDRIEFMLNDADVQLLITQQSLIGQVPSGDALQTVIVDAPDSPIANHRRDNPGIEITENQLVYVLYTSGSTGQPKGAMITHRNVLRLFTATDHWFHFDETDVWTMFHSYAFDFSVWEMWGALLYGGCVVVVPYMVSRSPEAFHKLLVDEKVTVLNQTPSAFQQLIAADLQSAKPANFALRYVIFGGEALNFQMLKPWFDRYGDAKPQLINMYGITETTVHVTYRPVSAADLRSNAASLIGVPIPDLEIVLLDEHLQPVPDGETGEICVGGGGVARGYWKREQLTNERFIPHPQKPGSGEKLYRSGDLAKRLPDGDLDYLGRMDFQVKIRGFRIELGEIEAAMVKHPAISQSLVIANKHPHSGEQRLVGYFVAKAAMNISEIRTFLGQSLPDYMIPAAFVKIDEFPLTTNGKIDRKALPEPGKERPNLSVAFVAPRSDTEKYLAEIWQEVLGIESIGVRDAFFELGGTSIQAGQFVARLYADLGEEVFVVTLFEKPTIEAFAKMLDSEYESALKRFFGGESSMETAASTVEQHIVTPEIIEKMKHIVPTVHLRDDDNSPKNPPALFILAPPRSGTTLFRTMLAGHPQLFAASELQLLLFNSLRERKDAFSGKWHVWLEGTIRAIMEIKNVDGDTARQMMHDFEQQNLSTKALYAKLQHWLGEQILVDKSPQYALDLQSMHKAERDFENALYVHMIRHPYAMVTSFQSVHMHQIMYLKKHDLPEKLLGELIWLHSQQNILSFLETVPESRKIAIWYEDLVVKPEATVQHMCRHFGIDFHPDMANPYKDMHKRMVDGIYKDSRPMGDLKMLEQKRVNPKLADRWQGVLDDNFLSDETWKVAEFLGYERNLARKTLFAAASPYRKSAERTSEKTPEIADTDIAIIGMAGRFPGAENVDQLWENLCNSVESIRQYSDEELRAAGISPEALDNPNYVRAGGTFENPEHFDAEFFGYHSREAALTDPQHRVFLETAYSALEAAGYDANRFAGKIGVFGGVGRNAYMIQHIAPNADLRQESDEYHMVIGYDKDFSTTRVAYKLNLRGPAFTVQSACSTSGVAIHLACQSLKTGDSDMAIAGGCRMMMPPRGGYEYTEGGPLSPDGHIRTFDADAKGMVRTSGAAIVVLKRLSDALRDGDTVHAVIKGSAINNDGSDKIGFTAPSVSGQTAVVAEAIEKSGVNPETIRFVEAHGTGTILGDPIEVAALSQAYRKHTQNSGFCAIGSVKTNIGHIDAGASAVGLIKTALALKHRQIPPTLHFTRPNPQLKLENSPFFVNTKLQPLEPTVPGTPRRAAVNSIGLGGTNAHIILEEAPEQVSAPTARQWQLLLLSAKTDSALDAATANLAQYFGKHPEINLADASFTLQTGRQYFEKRRIAVVENPADAASVLGKSAPQRLISQSCVGEPHSTVFMFAGGGAQYLNMGLQLYQTESVFREIVDECAELLLPMIDRDIRELIYPAETNDALAAEMEQPTLALATLFTIQFASAKLWMSWGVAPNAMIGHSMGEYTAACLSGVFSLKDALAMVVMRGKLFETLPEGAMLSVPLSEAELRPFLNDDLSIAAINRPDSCVASGTVAAIEQLQQTLASREIEATRVRINVAAHSQLVEQILDEFGKFLQTIEFHTPEIPLISNVTGEWANNSVANWQYWVKHLRQTVRFADGMSTLLDSEGRIFLEIGPGQILSSLARMHPQKSAARTIVSSMRHPRETTPDDQHLLTSLGRLWLAGKDIDWQKFYGNEKRMRVSLPTYPFERKRYWIDPPDASTLPNQTTQQHVFTGDTKMPQPAQPTATAPAVAATKPRKERIARKLQEILHDLSGVEIDALDPNVTFLELGFDSLFLSQANATIQRNFKVKISFRQLFEEAPTIDALSGYIDDNLSSDAFPPDPAELAAAQPQPVAMPQTAPQLPIVTPGIAPSPENAGALERVIQQQLQLMQHQLAAFGAVGQSTPAQTPAPPPTAPSVSPALKPKATPLPQSRPQPAPQINELNLQQQLFLDRFVAKYSAKTKTSKAIAAEQRQHLADPQVIDGFSRFWKEVVYPIAAQRSEGSRIWDVDGNEYIDMIMGFGVNLFGHQPEFIKSAVMQQFEAGMHLGVISPLAKEVARMVCEMTGHDRAHIVNTGSEAVLAAVRAARTATGRQKIAVFEGDYHGLVDEYLVRGIKTTDGIRTLPKAPGIPDFLTENTLLLDYTDDCFDAIRANADDLAAVIIEPITAVRPNFQPKEMIQKVRELTRELDIPLIFDELITGFRLHPKGAQGWYGIEADICSYGKALSGGMAMAVVAGKRKYMDSFDGGDWRYGDDSYPEGVVTYCVGTFMRNPMGLAASHAALQKLQSDSPNLQNELNAKADRFAARVNDIFRRKNAPIELLNGGSIIKFIFTDQNPLNGLFFFLMREKGVLLRERACFVSTAHSEADLDFVLRAIETSVDDMQRSGFMTGSESTSGLRQLPLTDQQMEIWLATQMGDAASCAYNMSTTIRLDGKLDESALRNSVRKLVDRHEALRITFDANGVFQQIAENIEVAIAEKDLSNLDSDARETELQKLQSEENRQPFDLVNGPLFRFTLIKLADDAHALMVCAHHLICDGWSMGILCEELGELYRSESRGDAPKLPDPKPFGEYAQQLSAFWRSEDGSATENFWLKQFQSPPQPLKLPVDFPKINGRTYRSGQLFAHIDAATFENIRSAAKRMGATAFSTLMSGFVTQLHRLSGQNDFAIGLAAAGQSGQSNANLVGHCVSLLPIRAKISPESTFKSLLGQIKTGLMDAFDHREYTYGKLLEKLRLNRDASQPPLLSVEITYESESASLPFGDLQAKTVLNPKSYANFDLEMYFTESENGLGIRLDYQAEKFKKETVERWLNHFKLLLESVIAQPETPLTQLYKTLPAEPLAAQQQASQPVDKKEDTKETHVEASTETEKKLIAIWREVLRIPDIGVTDEFYDLGGHSLLGVRILTRISDEFQIDLPLRSLLVEMPTIASLANHIDNLKLIAEPAEQPATADDSDEWEDLEI
ncbi:MAG: amino acid adenylation domain-containing protein [Calditrichae bacterium]|nr:amino acid adenylation domain-containing protein [Calditrichia bacterium]